MDPRRSFHLAAGWCRGPLPTCRRGSGSGGRLKSLIAQRTVAWGLAKNNPRASARRWLPSSGASRSMPCCSWQSIVPGERVADRPLWRGGGPELYAGPSLPFGEASAPLCGAIANFGVPPISVVGNSKLSAQACTELNGTRNMLCSERQTRSRSRGMALLCPRRTLFSPGPSEYGAADEL